MSTGELDLSASEAEGWSRFEPGLRRRFEGITLDERFDERVLARIRRLNDAEIAARRALAQQQFASWNETLARHWQSARHVLIARLAAFTTLAILAWIALTSVAPERVTQLAHDLGAPALSLPGVLTLLAAASVALGLGSARVKL